MDNHKSQFIYIVGPTGVGKSDFALEFAQKKSWPIINIDSLQVYKHLNIGTAKPTVHEMKLVPHYLFDYVEPPSVHSAAQYLSDVIDVIKKNKINKALFVGGSGFYIQALQKGLYPQSKTSSEIKVKVEKWIQQEGYGALYSWIKEKDLEFSSKISVNDHYRIRRSVEIMLSQNKNMTELKREMKQASFSPLPEHQALSIGFRLDKQDLLKKIEDRTKKMIANGLIEEVKEMRERGFVDWQPMQSVGYKEVRNFIEKNESVQKLEENIVTSTMQLIKKQMTWFRRSPEIKWFSPEERLSAFKTINEWKVES